MKDTIEVRLLVPQRNAEGQIEYHAEMHTVRLPLKREDRLALLERLSQK